MTDPDHRLSATDANVHHDWDSARDSALAVEPGDVVRFECRDATDGQLGPDATRADVRDIDFEGHALTGPVEVAGARPGDVLVVDLLDFEHHGVGWSYFYPAAAEQGLLPREFDHAGVHVWDLEGETGRFVDGIEVPLDPFPGVVGVAPAADGAFSTTPPRRVGGNLDVKHLTAGSTLFLPVEAAGALFSVGDGHAAQGDGEVCVTAIEAPLDVTVRLDVRSDLDLDAPRFETEGPFAPARTDGRVRATVGVADDMREAAREAVRGMLDLIESEYGLDRAEAYILASVAVDLKVNQAVNAPNWTVSAYLPTSIFP